MTKAAFSSVEDMASCPLCRMPFELQNAAENIRPKISTPRQTNPHDLSSSSNAIVGNFGNPAAPKRLVVEESPTLYCYRQKR